MSRSVLGTARFIGISLLALSLLLAQAGILVAQQVVMVRLDPVGGSGVSGAATLSASDGSTETFSQRRGFDS